MQICKLLNFRLAHALALKMGWKSSLLILFIFAYFISLIVSQHVANDATSKPIPKTENFPTSSFHCGDTIRGQKGVISYKNFEPVASNERCVWTIRNPEATFYTIVLRSLGLPGSLIITGVGLPNLETQIIPTNTSIIEVPESNVVVLTFFTGVLHDTFGKARGFHLQYDASKPDDFPVANSTSEDIIVPGNYGHIKFPTNRDVYAANESSVIIFTPPHGVSTVSGQTENEVIYITNDMKGCADSLTVFVFEVGPMGFGRWTSLKRICGWIDSEVVRHSDLIMLLFRSDARDQYAGFHLYAHSIYK